MWGIYGLTKLGEFIAEEMKKRDMSARKFSELVDVNHKTINKFLDPDGDPGNPSIEFLLKLAEATHTNVVALIGLAYPDVAEQMAISPNVEVLADRFSQLASNDQRVVLALINQLLSQGNTAQKQINE